MLPRFSQKLLVFIGSLFLGQFAVGGNLYCPMVLADRPVRVSPLLKNQVKVKKIESVALALLRPLQSQIGKAQVGFKSEALEQQAELISLNSGEPVNSILAELLQKQLKSGFHVYIDPEGFIRPDDGHHKLMAILQLIQKYKLDPKKFQMQVEIPKENDFRGRTWTAFATELQARGIMASNSDYPGEDVQKLPLEFSGLQNLPMRSTVARVFDILGVSGSQFNPMVQFQLGQALEQMGLRIEVGSEFSGSTVGQALDWFLDQGPPASQRLRQILQDNIRDGFQNSLKEALKQAESRWAYLKADFAQNESLSDEDLQDLEGDSKLAQLGELMSNSVLAFPKWLPQNLELPSSVDTYMRIFQLASEQEMPVKMKTAKKLLKDLEHGDFEKENRADRKLLKELRKFTLKLRSAFRFLSSTHQAPTGLQEFSHDLGELNDQIEKWTQGRIKIAALRQLAGQVNRLLLKNDNLFGDEIEVTSVSGGKNSFVEFNKDLLEKIQSSIAGPEMTVDQYHWLRRRVRDYANFFQMMDFHQKSVSTEVMFQLMNSLSRRMGTVKDGMLSSESADRFKNPGDRPTSLDPVSRQGLEKFLQIMQSSVAELETAADAG